MARKWQYPRAGQAGDPRAAAAVEQLCFELAEAGVAPIGPTLVRGYARFYRRLPVVSPEGDKSQMPFLYSLLGSGTPPEKMNKIDSAYQSRPVGQQRCENCSSAYLNLVSDDLICSQIEGTIERNAWCRLWSTDRF